MGHGESTLARWPFLLLGQHTLLILETLEVLPKAK